MWKAKVVAAGIFTVLVVWAAAPWFAIGATRNGFESLNEVSAFLSYAWSKNNNWL